MAAVVKMGEVDDVHPKDDKVSEGVVMNGEVDLSQDDVSTKSLDLDEAMEVDETLEDEAEVNDDEAEVNDDEAEVNDDEGEEIDDDKEIVEEDDNQEDETIEEAVEDEEELEIIEDEEGDEEEAEIIEDDDDEQLIKDDDTEVIDDEIDEKEEVPEKVVGKKPSQVDPQDDQTKSTSNGEAEEDIAHVIDSDDDDDVEMASTISDDEEKSSEKQNGAVNENGTDDEDKVESETVVLNDSNENDDVMIVEDTVKENGNKSPVINKTHIINLETPTKTKVAKKEPTPRRSGRNVRKSKHRILDDKSLSGESDVEEVLPDDPLAVGDPLGNIKPRKKMSRAVPIVVKDTKRLVEIASKSTLNSTKKEPTLVIIDTNSILSGRGPVPVSQKQSHTNSYPILPVALPAQGLYSSNMRATITPIPLSTSITKSTASPLPVQVHSTSTPQQQILPSLTDDMFVVEAPSFIVPYVYEKPPVKDLKDFIKTMADEIKRRIKEEEEKEDADDDKDSKNDESDDDIKKEKDEKMEVEDKKDVKKDKPHTFFDSPIGKFFVEIGSNLVQEFVQTDLLKQQKRKREREGGQNSATNKTIQSLIKGLEYTKENNQHYKMSSKRCDFCNYKTESALAMAFHLETPHMKNFVYRCNFCSYEVRNPHDILFHMEAEHCVRGRLERAPAFHQCPNCPFEDNQKGKLSRHSVACARKFKPDRNMEPPIDWEPPAKIPRAPRMKQTGLSTTAAMYQAMAKTSVQYMKMHQNASTQQQASNRGRGRPSLTVSTGGSVLVPTNYQLSGNQLYQVLGGQDIGSRIGGPMGLIPTMSSTSSTVSTQNQTTIKASKPMHQPSISITPLPRGSSNTSTTVSPPSTGVIPPPAGGGIKPGDCLSKNSFVICEICDGYIKDLEQLRNHMQWIHKVKIHPKMIYNRPPLNCQKCQFRFFTDQGLERHLLGSHGLVTSSMQEAANKCKDSGRCPVCGRVYQWKLLNHVARDHNMTLKPAHLSYKCTVCTATFGMYKQFENHVYSAHSVVAKRSMDKKGSNSSTPNTPKNELKPLKINDEITIIPQMGKSNGASSSKEGSPSTSSRISAKSRQLDKKEVPLTGAAIDSGEIQIINLG